MARKALSFLPHQDITMMIPLILHHCNLLSPFDLLSLIMISILGIFCNAGETSVQPAVTRRRRTRKPGNCISNWFAIKNHSLNQNGTCTEIRGAIDGFFVSTKEIAKGSNGTVVFEGTYQGRKVAVKRLVKNLNQVALKEVKHLIASDQHPNIVRMHGVKHDKEYVYLALERCLCRLSDLVSLLANSEQNLHESGNWVTGVPKHIYLWKNNGYPSALLLQLMRDMVKGLVHLHKRGIIHCDIKPQNIMISEGMDICAKLSEIGINKCLLSDKSSLTQNATGWIPLEQKHHKRQRQAADMFNLGCVFYFCLSHGGHPFDHHLKRDTSTEKSRTSLHLVSHIPEAVDLLSQLLNSNPKKRPKANQVLHHPLFWDSDMRLSFLRDVSDRLMQERRNRGSEILIGLESVKQQIFGARWDRKLGSELVKDIRRRRRYYGYKSVQQLLRVVRNKLNHYYESPKKIQELLGPVPEGLDEYFSCRFPRLLMDVYKVVIRHCKSEKRFQKYFGVDPVPVV